MIPTWRMRVAAVALLVLVAAGASLLFIMLVAAIAYGNAWDVLYMVASIALGVIVGPMLAKQILKRRK